MVTWGKFESLSTGQQLILFNTHLDYQSAQARELGAKLIGDRLSQLSNQGSSEALIFITGDFNAAPGSLPRNILGHPMGDRLKLPDVLSNFSLKQQMTFHDFTGKAFAAIDTIYCDRRVKLAQVNLDRRQRNGIWPSDHFPVIAEFSIYSHFK